MPDTVKVTVRGSTFRAEACAPDCAAAFEDFFQVGCQRHDFDFVACARRFHLRIEAYGFGRLQFDNQTVWRGLAVFKNMVLQRTEVQYDFRHFARHAFAGAQIEGNAFPTVVFDFGFDGDVGFGEAVLRNVDFLQIAVRSKRAFYSLSILQNPVFI